MPPREQLKITRDEIAQSLSIGEWAAKFPPVLDIEQAAALLRVPVSTIYQWRSQGRLKGCCQKLGRRIRFFRDRLLLRAMNEGV